MRLLRPIRATALPPALLLLAACSAVPTHRRHPPPNSGDASWTAGRAGRAGALQAGDGRSLQWRQPAAAGRAGLSTRPAGELPAAAGHRRAADRRPDPAPSARCASPDEEKAGAPRRQFIAAVRDAARRWQFSPLQINHWAADADGNSHVVFSETPPLQPRLRVPFRLPRRPGKRQRQCRRAHALTRRRTGAAAMLFRLDSRRERGYMEHTPCT